MSDKQIKVNDLDRRIRKIDDQIRDLEDTKFNLMFVRREIHMSDVKDVLTESWNKTLKEMCDDKT